MARFIRGEIVVVPFPISTGMDYKRRPALVLAPIPFGSKFDYLLCAMSATKEDLEHHLIDMSAADVKPGGTFSGDYYIRPTTLFTMDGAQLVYSLGHLTNAKLTEVLAVVRPLVA
ncbi:MAG: type II toxin-antitoxin system PemK/MazF family toxin [Fimbriimonadaceae bacterium]